GAGRRETRRSGGRRTRTSARRCKASSSGKKSRRFWGSTPSKRSFATSRGACSIWQRDPYWVTESKVCRKPRLKLTQHDVVSNGQEHEVPALTPIAMAAHIRAQAAFEHRETGFRLPALTVPAVDLVQPPLHQPAIAARR